MSKGGMIYDAQIRRCHQRDLGGYVRLYVLVHIAVLTDPSCLMSLAI